jgi:hypothetical protein
MENKNLNKMSYQGKRPDQIKSSEKILLWSIIGIILFIIIKIF